MYKLILENIETIQHQVMQTAVAQMERADCNCLIEYNGSPVREKKVGNDFNSNLKASYYLQLVMDRPEIAQSYTGMPPGFTGKFQRLLLYIAKCTSEKRILIISGPSSSALIRTLFFFNSRKSDQYYPPLPGGFRAYEHTVVSDLYQEGQQSKIANMKIAWQQQKNIGIYDIKEHESNLIFDGPKDEDPMMNILWQLITERLHEKLNAFTILGMVDTPFALIGITLDDELIIKLLDRCEIYYPDLDQDHSEVVNFTATIPVSSDYSFREHVN